MVATMLPHGNPIMYYGYVKLEENLARRSGGKQKMFEPVSADIRDRFTPRLRFLLSHIRLVARRTWPLDPSV